MTTPTLYQKVHIPCPQQETRDILIALLTDLGYEGFEEDHASLTAFIPDNLFNENDLNQSISNFAPGFSRETIQNRNWNEEWEKNFHPVRVDDFCVVRAGFHEPVVDVTHEIIITPKMSFGTGHHATTYMMMKAMASIDFTARAVLDFGTGTGVLAILAEKLGAGVVDAIDNDDWSIDNAAENIRTNECIRIRLERADHLEGLGTYDIILANINRNVLLAQLGAIAQHLLPGGVVVLSGLLAGDRESIAEAARKANLFITEDLAREGWIALMLTQNS